MDGSFDSAIHFFPAIITRVCQTGQVRPVDQSQRAAGLTYRRGSSLGSVGLSALSPSLEKKWNFCLHGCAAWACGRDIRAGGISTCAPGWVADEGGNSEVRVPRWEGGGGAAASRQTSCVGVFLFSHAAGDRSQKKPSCGGQGRDGDVRARRYGAAGNAGLRPATSPIEPMPRRDLIRPDSPSPEAACVTL